MSRWTVCAAHMIESERTAEHARSVLAALAVVLFIAVVSLWGGAGERVDPDSVDLTIDAAAARSVLSEFVVLLNAGIASTAFALMADDVRRKGRGFHGQLPSVIAGRSLR